MFNSIAHAIKVTAVFLYHFFFIDQATGQQSNTKFFANVGYIIWCALFPYAVIHGSQASFDLWLTFGAVVIGNRTLNVMMQNKAGAAGDPDSTWKGVDTSKPAPVVDAPKPADVPPQKVTKKMAAKTPKTDDLVE